MDINVPDLVTLLRSLPGLKYSASNGVHIKLTADERQLRFWVSGETEKVTDQQIEIAVKEAFVAS